MAAESDSLRAMADKCRRLARSIDTPDVAERLRLMADDYARRAEEADAGEPAPVPPNPPTDG
ncbi:MAG: hypothetical protein JO013_04495 [Alphaproteobacteria bacterium]|nr:hypothetical protein [Alphaproteobacteria bacterium]